MKLANTYVIGTLVMWYEIEMLEEHVDACLQMLNGVDNPENITFHYCFNCQEYLERIDQSIHGENADITYKRFLQQMMRLESVGALVMINVQRASDPFFNIARFRRTLNFEYCEKVDYVLWGETDSLWPASALTIIESVHERAAPTTPKFLLTFAYRRNWDSSWDGLVHPMFESIPFADDDEFVLNNEASEKSYMSMARMNEINDVPLNDITIVPRFEPKADGSCLVISSDLIRSGVNIPHGIIHNAEDIAMCEQAKLVMGHLFVQYHVSNILRVHNRRHPRKRTGIMDENNPSGFCDDRKGSWWKMLESSSNYNHQHLRNQTKLLKVDEVIRGLGK